jgi:hypothetical protein
MELGSARSRFCLPPKQQRRGASRCAGGRPQLVEEQE